MDARHSSEQKHTLLVEDAEDTVPPGPLHRSVQTHWKTIALVVLALSNLLLLTLLLVPRLSVAGDLPASTGLDPDILAQIAPPATVPSLPKKAVRFSWYTPYNNVENQTASNELWDKISSSHGLIALDHHIAKENQWLESMPVPGDEGKGLYLLESYHQLHCLKIVRTMFLESIDGAPLSKPASHALHCFDYFRQFIMCHADNTPLYTVGDHTSGSGQVHMCNDWTALRDYATENSACFKDRVGDETVGEQFGHCDDGTDGLEGAVLPLSSDDR